MQEEQKRMKCKILLGTYNERQKITSCRGKNVVKNNSVFNHYILPKHHKAMVFPKTVIFSFLP